MSNDKRSAIIQLYVTDEEKRRIESRAKAKGIPTAVYVRMLALEDAGELPQPKSPDKRTK